MVLFLFVIMLVNVGAEEREQEVLFNRTGQTTAAVCFAALLVFGLFYAINQSAGRFVSSLTETSPAASAARDADLRPSETRVARISEDTQRVGSSLYRYGGLPFEIASVLLLVAIVGSVLLARTSKQELATDDVDPEVVSEMSAAGELTPADIEEASHAHALEV
jgi:NADH-quinone oxidoreductase subunit J